MGFASQAFDSDSPEYVSGHIGLLLRHGRTSHFRWHWQWRQSMFYRHSVIV